jgi:hypothetical protein
MDISSMRAYIRSVVEIDSSDISNDVLNRFLGEGYDQVVYSEKRWPWYEISIDFDTVGGTSDYTLAVVGADETLGLREVAALRSGSRIVQYIGRDEGDAAWSQNTSSSGQPAWWSFWADTVRLYPTPSGAEKIYVRGFRNPTAFGAGTGDNVSPSDFPEPFHIVIATYGIARAYEQQEDPTMASQYFSIFNAELDTLRARHLDTPAPQPLTLNQNRLNNNMWMPNRLRYSWE